MTGQWDDSLKIFISENPQDLASWLLGEAQVKVKLLTEFKTRTIEAGALLEVTLRWKLPNGREVLQFHFESVELGKLSTESLRRTGLTGLLPL